MTTYYSKEELKTAMENLVDEYLKECLQCQTLPEDFVELIKHNFLAKFVSYNRKTQNIEIGIEDTTASDELYPTIDIYKFPVCTKNKKWVENSFKTGKNDLAYYGRLLNRKKTDSRDADVVVM